jgi:hypothetical protein
MGRSPQEKARRAQRERERRAANKAAGIKPTRPPDYKEKQAARERERRKTPEAKQRELEWRRQNRKENPERYRTYNREFQRRRRSELKLLGIPDPHAPTPEYLKAYREKDPVRYAFMKRSSKYRISIDQQKAMLDAQLWRCANLECRVDLKGRTMQLDHCHNSDKPRAFLCGDCNAALGRMNDDPKKLRGLADYIERFSDYAATPTQHRTS